MNLDAYRLALDGTGRHKMRALSLLAEGTRESRFEAAALLHDVARAEQRAVRALEQLSHEVRLAASVERCWSLIEGLDPPAAANAYGEVLRASEALSDEQSDAMRARLDPKFAKVQKAYANALVRAPTLQHLGAQRSLGHVKDKELEALLEEFPGVAKLWFARGLAAKNAKDAWRSIRRAARLEPEDDRFRAGSLQLVGQVLSGDELREFLDAAYESLSTSRADVCLFYALAEIEYAQGNGGNKVARRASLSRAREASLEGESRSASVANVETGLRPALHAVRILADTILAGRKPEVAVLYEAGLGELVVTAQRHGGDLLAVIRAATRFAEVA
jgi:hypothetical protein